METDYCNTPGSVNNNLDFHFIPHAGLIPELVEYGVPEENIRVSGIPVKKNILRKFDKRYAKHLLGIPEDHDHILLMGGSMGAGPIPAMLELMTKELPSTDISVVCGTNANMKIRLEEAFGRNPRIHIFGYMPDMFWIYKASDIFVTKPGGICTTEAGVIGLPMVLLNVVGCWELFNLEYFTQNNAALAGSNEYELTACCKELILNKEKLNRMSEQIQTLVNPQAAAVIRDCFVQ